MSYPIYIYSGSNIVCEDDNYLYMRWTNSYWGMDTFEFVINRHNSNASNYAINTVIKWNGHQGIIEDKIHKQGSDKVDDLITFRGTTYGLFHKRICWNGVTSGTGYDRKNDHAETVMKYYVDKNCISTTNERIVPNLTLEADCARGATVDYRARLQTVSQVLEEVGKFSGLGWEVSNYQFKIVDSHDRSASQSVNPVVFLKSEFGNIETQEYQELGSKYYNTFYIGDASTGINRTFTIYGKSTGLSRKEMFVDAPDLSTTQQRVDRGITLTKDYGQTYGINLKYLPCMFQYGTDFHLGDIITYSGSDVVADVRIIEATEQCQGDKLDIDLTLNRQLADFIRLYKSTNNLNNPTLRR
jgi:hypothetical protein